MQNLWSDGDAEAMVGHYAGRGVNRDLALRVYTSRLLGREPRLVLHGGGNTSVKTTVRDMLGNSVDVLCVKGSGWDLGDIEPAGLPAVRLEPLRQAARLAALTDEEMVNLQRTNLLDAEAPNPSVETLLHAFLPHKFVDHTHANAVLALTDQEDGERLCRDVFGRRMGYVPYIMPGFALAKKAQEVLAETPDVEGLVLLKHGIFTFGASAKEAYDHMIAAVSEAEAHIGEPRTRRLVPARLPNEIAPVSEVAPVLRGLTSVAAGDDWRRLLLEFRSGPKVLEFVNGAELARYSQQGTATPDHVIRTKAKPLIVPAPAAGSLDGFRDGAAKALADYTAAYRAYFARNNARQARPKTELDPMPRVILVPGLGLFGLGETPKAARIAADLAETNIEVIADAEAMGRYEVIPEADIFDMEYWSLEQAKLGKAKEKPLQRQIAAVTGAGSGIGAATARALADAGAVVAAIDKDRAAAGKIAAAIGGLALECDVTDATAVKAAMDRIAATFGGIDLVVSNAGAAWQGRIGDVDDATLRQSFELNFFAHQSVAREAVRLMRLQRTGGCLLFNASKQAVNPGRDFGPYGLPKAATLFLMRQYALDYGEDRIRSNAVNADRIRSGLLTDEMIRSRAAKRGVGEAEYMSGNLLGREVTAADVARAFVDLALALKTTGAVMTVDGGNIAAALR